MAEALICVKPSALKDVAAQENMNRMKKTKIIEHRLLEGIKTGP